MFHRPLVSIPGTGIHPSGVSSSGIPLGTSFGSAVYPISVSPVLPSGTGVYPSGIYPTVTVSSGSGIYPTGISSYFPSGSGAPTNVTLTVIATSVCSGIISPDSTALTTVKNTVIVTTTDCPPTETASALSKAMSQASANGLDGYTAVSFEHDDFDREDTDFINDSINTPGETIIVNSNELFQYHSDSSQFNGLFHSGDFDGETHGGESHELSHSHLDGFRQIIRSSITSSSPAATEAPSPMPSTGGPGGPAPMVAA